MTQTKIVCTIGPACQDEETLGAMIRAGMNVARLNFSHGTHEEHAGRIAMLRRLADNLAYPLAILQDLSGPKVRIGEVPGGALRLDPGDPLTLSCGPTAAAEAGAAEGTVIPLPFPGLIRATRAGCCVLLDDGSIQLEVESHTETGLRCRTMVGGTLKPHKGVSVPGVSFPMESLTPRDLEDLEFGLSQDVDWIALSYVRSAEDVRKLRKAIAAQRADTPIMVKIEKHEAVANLPEIIAAADGVMVARGDLGVELPLEEVPMVQKRIIAACNAAGKPVVTATQMLESMIQNPRPTRAEVTDICNAILDGTDAVMLSGETAVGDYPVEAVRVMKRVAGQAEGGLAHSEIRRARSLQIGKAIPEAISEGTTEIAARLGAAAIICATSSGSMARMVSRFRPEAPIIAATTSTNTWNRLALSWGVHPVLVPRAATFDRMIDDAVAAASRAGMVQDGDVVIVTAGSAIEVPGSTNLLKVQVVGRPDHLG